MSPEPSRRLQTSADRAVESMLRSVPLRAGDLHPKTVEILARAALEETSLPAETRAPRAKETEPRP